ncbi:MAG: MBL fold metallo-hydrolase [Clostridiales bacterium]|nr:MBL fold metallo-hydrolase [Clostridiales bacterium]
MKLLHLRTGLLRVNTFFIINEETKSAIVIDCGENYKLVKKVEQEHGVKIKAVLLTHAHFDHSGIAKKLQDDGAKIYISKIDAPKLLNDDNLSADFGRKFDYLNADYTFSDGEEFIVEGISVKALITPGHTDGSACFIIGGCIFSGDTLFLECVGRTDFKTGNKNQMIASVKRLFALDGDYAVYPGHDEFTSLSHERKYNLFADYD